MARVYFLIFFAFISYSSFSNNLVDKAEALATLREEVESIRSELTDKEDLYRQRLKAFSLEESELHLQLKRLQLKKKEVLDGLATTKVQLKQSSSGDELASVLLEASNQLANYVTSSTLFQRADRLKAIGDFRAKLKAKELSAEQGLPLLWSLFEDELRLSRQNSLQQQEIEVNDESYLAEVINLGNVGALFNVNKEFYGYSQNNRGRWVWVRAESLASAEIEKVFDSFRNSKRFGEFSLPLNSMNTGISL